jgi:uncharacterized surface anchored protein
MAGVDNSGSQSKNRRRSTKISPLISCGLAGAALLVVTTSALAQNAAAGATPAPANTQQVAPGDHWTFEQKDEISGAVRATRTTTVTEVTKDDVAVRVDLPDGKANAVIYDRSWNRKREGTLKYSPNDGRGYHLPLALNAQWNVSANETNSANGTSWKIAGKSRVTGQEAVTTKAGTFQTFVVELNYTLRNVANPTQVEEFSVKNWFDPDINHWVKRTVTIRREGHLFRNDSYTLTDYGRKKP